MSTPRRPVPDEMPRQAGHDPAVDALLDYLASTVVTPSADVVARIQARVEREPDRTPPRRFVFALLHLRLRIAAGAFRQLVRVAQGQGRFSTLLRAQALSLVLLSVLATTALVAGAAVGITQLVQDRRTPAMPTPTMVTDPDRTSTPSPALETPRPTDADTIQLVDPTPRKSGRTPVPASRTSRPEAGRRPSRTTAPERAGDADPEATRRPARTSQPTERPDPVRTPKPEKTPRPTKQPEQTEPPDDDEGDDDGDGHDEDDRDGDGEPDAPDGDDEG